MVELEKVYDALADEVLEEECEDLAVGQGRNYEEAKHRAWKALPEYVDLDKTEIIELAPEGDGETFVAYRHRVKDGKALYEQAIEAIGSLFSSSPQGEKDIHQIRIHGEKFSVDIEEAEDEYTDVDASGSLRQVSKYNKTYQDLETLRAEFAHAKEKVKESQEKAALAFEQEKVRRIAQISREIEKHEPSEWTLVEGGVQEKTYENPKTGEEKKILETEDMRKALTYRNDDTGQELEITYPDPEIGDFYHIDEEVSNIYIEGDIRNENKKVHMDPQEPISVILHDEEGDSKTIQRSKKPEKAADSALEILNGEI